MRRLNRYIGTTVFTASLGSLLVLVGLNSISELIVEVRDLDQSYTFKIALLSIALRLPSAITEFMSYGIFLGSIIGLGMHANNNELSVMRSAGVSFNRFLWAVMRPTLILLAIGFLLGEYVNPVANNFARGLKDGEDIRQRTGEAPFGHWYRDKENGDFLHFNRVEVGGRIFGVTRYRFDADGKLIHAGFAEQAIYQRDGYWQLENYQQSDIYDDHIELSNEAPNPWRTELSPQLLNILVLPPESLSIRSLYQFAVYRDRQNLQSHEYWLGFWQRVLQPLMVLSLVLVGMSFIFGSLREATMGSRVFLAVVVGFFFKVNMSMLGTVSSIIGFSALVAVLAPIILCAAVGLLLLTRR